MSEDQHLFYNLLKKDALLIIDGVAYTLDGPFESREAAEIAAEAVVIALKRNETGRIRSASEADPADGCPPHLQ